MNFKHIAKIEQCFELEKYLGEYCVISEPLDRDFMKDTEIQSGISILIDAWIEHLHCSFSDVYTMMDEAYYNKDAQGEVSVLRFIENSKNSPAEKRIALALNGAYKEVMQFESAMIWPSAINMGLADDGTIKITHIGIR